MVDFEDERHIYIRMYLVRQVDEARSLIKGKKHFDKRTGNKSAGP